MTLYFLQGTPTHHTPFTKPLFEQHDPWTTLINEPNAMYCALIRANSEAEARSLAQSTSKASEPVWQDHRWSSCTAVDVSMELLIDPHQQRGIVKVGLVSQFLTPF